MMLYPSSQPPPYLPPTAPFWKQSDFGSHGTAEAHSDYSDHDDDCYGSELEGTADYDADTGAGGGDGGGAHDDSGQGSREAQAQGYESEHETAREEAEDRYASWQQKGKEEVAAAAVVVGEWGQTQEPAR